MINDAIIFNACKDSNNQCNIDFCIRNIWVRQINWVSGRVNLVHQTDWKSQESSKPRYIEIWMVTWRQRRRTWFLKAKSKMYSSLMILQIFSIITFKKQMHRCDLEIQKKPGESIICTKDYFPTFADPRLKSNVTGTKYNCMPYGDDELLGNDDLFNPISDFACATLARRNNFES